jgi:hypothetical protein
MMLWIYGGNPMHSGWTWRRLKNRDDDYMKKGHPDALQMRRSFRCGKSRRSVTGKAELKQETT